MRRVSKFLLVLSICALAVLPGQAQTARNVKVNFKETTLKNGLRVITVEDHSAPVIAVSITYNVGSRNERQGRTGFAHLSSLARERRSLEEASTAWASFKSGSTSLGFLCSAQRAWARRNRAKAKW